MQKCGIGLLDGSINTSNPLFCNCKTSNPPELLMASCDGLEQATVAPGGLLLASLLQARKPVASCGWACLVAACSLHSPAQLPS